MFVRIRRWLEFNRLYLRKAKPPWDSGVVPPELREFMAHHAPDRALDLGCGTGTNVIALAQAGWQATGVDFVPKAISVAKRKARAAGVKADLRVGDVTILAGIRGPFDLILDLGCFHGLPNAGKDAYAARVKALLADRGAYLVYMHIKTDPAQRSGILDDDLGRFAPLRLMQRVDGMDAARGRRSAWLTFVP